MKRFKNILYHADGAESPSTSLDRAVALARSNNAALTIVDVVPESNLGSEVAQRFGLNLNALLRQRRLEELEVLTQPHRNSDVRIYTQVVSGTPFIELIRAVQLNGYDLLIKAPRPPEGLTERLLGSADMHILRKCPCPVWMNRPESAHPYRNIVAAVDPTGPGSADLNRLIMDLASSLARRESAELHVVHAWRLVGESMLASGRARVSAAELQQMLSSAEQNHRQKLGEFLSSYGLMTESPHVNLVKASASKAISSLSEAVGADLIVMGTVGRTGIPGLIIGNTAEEVLQTTKASILAVKPSGFVSPVIVP